MNKDNIEDILSAGEERLPKGTTTDHGFVIFRRRKVRIFFL